MSKYLTFRKYDTAEEAITISDLLKENSNYHNISVNSPNCSCNPATPF